MKKKQIKRKIDTKFIFVIKSYLLLSLEVKTAYVACSSMVVVLLISPFHFVYLVLMCRSTKMATENCLKVFVWFFVYFVLKLNIFTFGTFFCFFRRMNKKSAALTVNKLIFLLFAHTLGKCFEGKHLIQGFFYDVRSFGIKSSDFFKNWKIGTTRILCFNSDTPPESVIKSHLNIAQRI